MKRIREKTSSFTSEEHDILNGKATITRLVCKGRGSRFKTQHK